MEYPRQEGNRFFMTNLLFREVSRVGTRLEASSCLPLSGQGRKAALVPGVAFPGWISMCKERRRMWGKGLRARDESCRSLAGCR